MHMDTMYKTGKGKVSVTRAVLAILILMLAIVEPGMASKKFKHGYVMARSMVLDDNGQPILVEFDEQGNEIGELPIPSQYANRVDELEIVSANAIESQQERHETFLDNNPELAADARLLPRDQVAGVTFPLADNQRDIKIEESDLNPGTLSVLIAGQSSRFLEDVQAVVLQEYPFDLTQSLGSVAGARSVVLNRDGGIVATSQYIVAPRVGFYGKDGEISDLGYGFDPGEDEVFGPVAGVRVYIDEFLYPEAQAATGSDGSYHLSYHLMTCPPGGFEFNTDVWARLNYTSFSPLGQDALPYYLRAKSWDHCFAYIDPRSGMLIETPIGSYMARLNLYVDVMFLTGELTMENPDGTSVTVTDEETQYEVEGPDDTDEPKATEWYDFDNDGKADRSEIGRMVDLPDDDTSELVFTPDPEGDVQGVYFSSSDPAANGQTDEQTPPDVIRQIDEDREQRIEESTGLLSQINRDDLRNTDILVFRSATGELVLERQGLRDEEVHYGEVAVGSEGNAGYRLMMRGPMDSMHNVGGGGVNRRQSFQEWATEYQLTEPFRSRDAFHLQPGEWVDIVAINRTTGYTGKQRAQLKSAADSPAGELSIVVEPIKLRPPNLRIWAERDYNIDKGMTEGESRDGNIISAEGAGLQSDQQIVVYSEWLAHDGSALPEGLSAVDGAQYGLTGRLAKVVGADLLQATGFQGELAEFPIAPGRQTQVLQLNDNLANPEHFYIHVIGKARNQEECTGGSCADFDYTGSDAGVPAPLDTRPRFITPILTPHYDEQSHWLAYREYRRLLREGEDPANGDPVGVTDPTRPTPTHVWNHRPEYQFSRYSLEIDEINRVQVDPDTGDETSEDIFNTDTPVIGSSDNLVDILYSLIGPEFDRLSPIDGGQDLILALGEEETRIELGEDNTLRIDNLEHLAGLDPEDFLTMRLYLNQDAGNVLWEYAFEYLSIYAPNDSEINETVGDYYFLSADAPVVELEASLLSYLVSGTPLEEREEVSLKWNVEGAGATATPQVQTNKTGIFRTEITVPPNAGSRVKVSATILGSNDTVSFPEIVVVPGLPHDVSVSVANTAYTRGIGELHSTISVRDQAGNAVRGGTPVGISIQGDGYSGAKDLLVDSNGLATVTLKGGNFPGPGNTIVAQSLSAKSSAEFSIGNVETTLAGIPSTVGVDSSHKVVVKALAGGQPAVGAPIDISVDYGSLHAHNSRTNGDGEIIITWHAGSTPGQATFRACSDGEDCDTTVTTDIADPNPLQSTSVSVQSLLVGDQLSDGSITHQKYDGTTLNLPYRVESDLSLKGESSGDQLVTLGSLWNPNRNPSLDWPMNELIGRQVMTAAGKSEALIDSVILSQHIGEEVPRAYRFDGNATIGLVDRQDIKSDRLGFRLRLKPTAFGGELFNLSGAHRLTLLDNGSLRYTVKTTTGEYHVETPSLQLGKWYQVAGRFVGGQLELVLDDQDKVVVPVGGELDYAASDLPDGTVLKLGHSYVGHMAQFLVYNPATEPLLVFTSSNSEKSNLTFDAESKTSTRIRANGKLSPDVTQSISVVINNTSVGSLELMGTDVIRRSLGVYASIHSDVPQLSELKRIQKNAMEAGKQSYIAQQILGATLDTATFDTSDSVMAALAALEFLPHRETFENHILGLQKLFHETGNPAAFRAASDSIGIRVKQSLLGNHEGLDRVQLALMVWGEIINENPAVATFVAESVNSKEDFDTWVRFFSLPAKGWIGYEPPVPRLNSDCAQNVPLMDVGAGIQLPLVTCRLNGKTVANIVQGFMDDNQKVAQAPGILPPLLNIILDDLPHADMFFRRYFLSAEGVGQLVHNDTYGLIPDAHAVLPAVAAAALRIMVRVGVKATVGAVKNISAFVMGKTNSRLSPLASIAAMAYLETRMQSDCGGCKKLPEQLHQKIHNLEKLFFINMAYKGKATEETAKKEFACKIWNGTQGKQFEVAMVAYFHAMHEFLDKDEFEVIDIQRNRTVKLLNPETGMELSSFRRDYDIVLAGEDQLPVIVEVKSAQARYTRDGFSPRSFDRRFPLWSAMRTNRRTGNATRTTVHRQLLLDAVASTPVAISDSETQRHASDYLWLWQDWAKPRDRRIQKRRDPGVSIWRQEVNSAPSAGDHLRERLREIGYDRRAKGISQKTLGVDSPNYLLPLSERVAALGLQRFGKVDWRSLIEAPQDGGSIKDQLYAQLDNDTRSVLRKVEQAERKIISIDQHIDDAADYIRGKLDELIGKPEWLEEAEKTLRELEDEKEKILDEIDNKTLEYTLPDDISNQCL